MNLADRIAIGKPMGDAWYVWIHNCAVEAATGEPQEPGQVFGAIESRLAHVVSYVQNGRVHALHPKTFRWVSYPSSECYSPQTAIDIGLRMAAELDATEPSERAVALKGFAKYSWRDKANDPNDPTDPRAN